MSTLTLAVSIESRLPQSLRYRALLITAFVINLLHPLVHGTPIDGGLWDGVVAYLNNQAMTSSHEESAPHPTES